MRPTTTIDLPASKCKAEIITYWSWAERQSISRTLLEGKTIDPENPTNVGEIKAEAGLDYQKRTLEMAVKKLIDPEGKEIPVAELFDLPASDVDLILSRLNVMDEVKKN